MEKQSKEPVRLRKRTIKDGSQSLYLDITPEAAELMGERGEHDADLRQGPRPQQARGGDEDPERSGRIRRTRGRKISRLTGFLFLDV